MRKTPTRLHNYVFMRRLGPALTFAISFALLYGVIVISPAGVLGEQLDFTEKSHIYILTMIGLVSSLVSLLIAQLVSLHESRENLRLTIESSTDIVMLLDAEARYLEVFSSSETMLAASSKTIRGKTVSEILGPDLGARVTSAIADVLATGEKQSIVYSIVLGGVEKSFEAVISKRDSNTVVAMIRDTTREKNLSLELDEQRRFMENILDSISDPVFMKNEKHEWLYGNKAFSEVLGRAREDYYGKTDFAIFPHEIAKKFFESDDQMFKQMQEFELEETIFQAGSEPRTILTKKTPFTDKSGKKTLIGIIRDITDRKQMEQQLQEERARQIAASRLASLGEMAGGVAHEINNPLAIISGYTGRLFDVLNTEPFARERAQEIVRRLDTTTTRIATIVKGLRAIARDGSFDPRERVAVADIIEDTLGLCVEKFRNNGVTVEADVEPGLTAFCRSVQISQVLLNLLTNAFFAVFDYPNSKIEVRARSAGGFAEISVTDSGAGIDVSIRERIFEPFFTTKPVGMGTGLGLSIATSIVREHDGELFLDSSSTATRFVIRIPARPFTAG